jgi:hypothetical protein
LYYFSGESLLVLWPSQDSVFFLFGLSLSLPMELFQSQEFAVDLIGSTKQLAVIFRLLFGVKELLSRVLPWFSILENKIGQ